MDMMPGFVADLALILISASVLTLLCRKLNQPVIIGYIIAGFLISPHFQALPTVIHETSIEVWAELGIIFLMFGIGLEFNFKKIGEVGSSAIITALTVVSCMTFAGFFLGTAMGMDFTDSIFLGGMISMSSTMVILKSYDELNLKQEKYAKLVTGVLVIEDIAGVFMMVILAAMSAGKSGGGFVETLPGLLMMMLYLLLWVVAGIYLLPSMLRVSKKYASDELMLILSLAICMAMVLIANAIGFSTALGAFMAGSILACTTTSKRIDKLVTPVKDLFGAIFFVSVGMKVQPEMLISYWWQILLLVVVTILGQSFFAVLGILFSGNDLKTSVCGGLSMVQVGEFSFIIATLGESLGVIGGYLYPMIVFVSVITIFTTPVFMKNSERVYRFIDGHLPQTMKLFLRKYTSSRNSTTSKDKDWSRYLSQFFIRTSIFGSLIVIEVVFGFNVLKPFLYGLLEEPWDKVALLAAMSVMIVPSITLMLSKRKLLYTKLWQKKRTNRLPLVVLNAARLLLSAIVIVYVIRHIFEVPYIPMLVIALAVVVIAARADFMKGAAIGLEMRFMANFNEEALAKQQEERNLDDSYRWIDERLYVCEVQIVKRPKTTTIQETKNKNKHIFIMVIKIIRDGRHINLPKGSDEIREGDLLYVMGTRDQIETYLYTLQSREHMSYHGDRPVTLRESLYAQIFYEIEPVDQLIHIPVLVEKKSPFCYQPIKNTHFRAKYGGYIIGIERNRMTILRPAAETVIYEGDLLWVLGTPRMANALLIAGLLDFNQAGLDMNMFGFGMSSIPDRLYDDIEIHDEEWEQDKAEWRKQDAAQAAAGHASDS